MLSIVLYFELFSCLCIFYVTIGDHLHTLYPHVSVTKHMMVTAVVLAVPTALLTNPKLLSYLSVCVVHISLYMDYSFERL